MLVSIVIPCYNSEQTIEKVVDLCMEQFEQMPGYECEMILVNDFSKDGTFDAICRAAEKYNNVTGINLAKNFGQHAAIMAGLHYVRGELVMAMDDDLQNHPSQIPLFLNKEKEGYDVVFGVFKERHFTRSKNITGAISRFLLFKMIDRPKELQMGSFWLARRYVIDKCLEYEGNGAFVQLLFFRTTHHIANIEIDHFDRAVGTSNYTFKKGLKHFMSMLNYSDLPLKLATFLGAVFAIVGFAAAIVVLIAKIINPSMQAGWPSIMCTLLILFGITFIILGILGEYIGRTLFAVNKAPQYVIRDVVGRRAPKVNDRGKYTSLSRPIDKILDPANLNFNKKQTQEGSNDGK